MAATSFAPSLAACTSSSSQTPASKTSSLNLVFLSSSFLKIALKPLKALVRHGNGASSLGTHMVSVSGVKPPTLLDFETSIFIKEKITFAGHEEYIVRGQRDLFPLLLDAFKGIKQIGVIDWGLQGLAQAFNLRDSLAEAKSDIVVKVGLRNGSHGFAKARAVGFTEESGTLGDMWETIPGSDLVLPLICDAAQIEIMRKKGHSYSEIINESVIEAVDCLNPSMHGDGVSFVVDNCSTTARLGSRKWAVRCVFNLIQSAFPTVDKGAPINRDLIDNFLSDPVHGALDAYAELRPTVDKSVPPHAEFLRPMFGASVYEPSVEKR